MMFFVITQKYWHFDYFQIISSCYLSLSLFFSGLSRICFKDEMCLIKTLHVPRHLWSWSIAYVQINLKHDLHSTHDFVLYGYKGLTRFQIMLIIRIENCCYIPHQNKYLVGQRLRATELN